MSRIIWIVLFILPGSCLIVAGKNSKAELEAALKQSDRDSSTPLGKRYRREFEDKIFTDIADKALLACLSEARDTVEPAMLVFIVSADGKITRVLSSPGIEYGECIVSKLRVPLSVPRPPHDNFAVAVGVANHSHAQSTSKAPPDKPVRVDADQVSAYDKAVAPYVAKARATYPAAKKRFLAGLKPGWRFAVSYRLYDTPGQFPFEDVIVQVDSIKDGIVHGRIANKLGSVKNYQYDQAITFPESKVTNWLFVRPDGSEEGNIVGKFLDHYKPRSP